jgi:hypothetical protein
MDFEVENERRKELYRVVKPCYEAETNFTFGFSVHEINTLITIVNRK